MQRPGGQGGRAGQGRLAGADPGGVCALVGHQPGKDYSTGAALVEELDPKRMNYVELSCGERSAAFLRGALSAMDEEACRIRQATAPALA